ncbi:conserved hypothetical protein [Ricinus communis]|uniref:Uncharacterized protein n=1 Tax=Ricinus communis TaxID=3988 RepID=B9SDU8_RICCO|nr:conserved hypothetical protein [Ricinus communis]
MTLNMKPIQLYELAFKVVIVWLQLSPSLSLLSQFLPSSKQQRCSSNNHSIISSFPLSDGCSSDGGRLWWRDGRW